MTWPCHIENRTIVRCVIMRLNCIIGTRFWVTILYNQDDAEKEMKKYQRSPNQF